MNVNGMQATVGRELKLGSVGLTEAIKAASMSCNELAFWAQTAWTSLQSIPKEALDAVEANLPEEVSPPPPIWAFIVILKHFLGVGHQHRARGG